MKSRSEGTTGHGWTPQAMVHGWILAAVRGRQGKKEPGKRVELARAPGSQNESPGWGKASGRASNPGTLGKTLCGKRGGLSAGKSSRRPDGSSNPAQMFIDPQAPSEPKDAVAAGAPVGPAAQEMIGGRPDPVDTAATTSRGTRKVTHGVDAAGPVLTAGQEHALARLVHAWELRQAAPLIAGYSPRAHPLLVGPSGSGKTFLVRELARRLGLPVFAVTVGGWPRSGRWWTPCSRPAASDSRSSERRALSRTRSPDRLQGIPRLLLEAPREGRPAARKTL